MGGWRWPPGISAESGGTGPKLPAPGPLSKGLGVAFFSKPRLSVSPPEATRRQGLRLACGPHPVPASLLLASRTATTTVSMGALARGPGPRSAGPLFRSPAAAHALLFGGKVIAVAVAPAIPEAVTLAHGGDEVPAGSPVRAGAVGAGQQAPHGVCCGGREGTGHQATAAATAEPCQEVPPPPQPPMWERGPFQFTEQVYTLSRPLIWP